MVRPGFACPACVPSRGAPADRDTPVKVLIKACDPLSQIGIGRLVHGNPFLTEVAADEADVVLMAVSEFSASVMRLLRSVVLEPERTRVVVILDRLGEPDLLAAAELGVTGFLYRSQATGEHVSRVVASVHQGATHLPPEVQVRLMADVAQVQRKVLTPRGLSASGLDQREVEVLRCIAEGLENSEIAERMQYSERTVKSILYAMTERLQLRNRSHAVAYAMRAGVL
ncbi:helix-turn-helix transcriptional regulator [Kineosporia babensis]|uniref:Response regulator transcription factor n=1 Tax=Kineosporia babensis TaxID=499548 RepID=A0A9X1STJ2_9ACTN|nr:response regulator transcription factor [Kineosporia babensis]